MPVGARYSPDPRFALLGEAFGREVTPATFPSHVLRWRDPDAAALIGLDTLTDAEWITHFGLFEPLPDIGQKPFAMAYHGHQFRTYNPDLGDGRGFLLGQLRDQSGRLLDLGTKGSGQTPWSRRGDGRLTLKGGVREILAARLLDALGVNTSHTLSLIETGEALVRGDEPSPTRSAVLVRLQHSHVRFGTFQRLAYFEETDNLALLVDHCVDCYYPELADLEREAKVAAFAHAVTQATARMVAGWIAAGFVHGVLNTDNMNVTGQSFDYGPWRFLPYADANFTAAYFDQTGLYAFGRQAVAGLWNLRQWAGTLRPLCADTLLNEAIATYPQAFAKAQCLALCARLGVERTHADGLDFPAMVTLLDAMFAFLTRTGAPWDGFFHDWFGGPASATRAMASPRAHLYQGPEFEAWQTALDAFTPTHPHRLNHPHFHRPDPVSLVIDDVEALWTPIATDDDWTLFGNKIAAIAGMRAALRG